VVFVKGLMEGETCKARILKAGKNVAYAKIEELIEPSEHRIAPDCPVYGKCGGCALRHMDYEEELRFKKQRVTDALSRIGGVDVEIEEIIGADSPDGYRNKTIYSVERIDGSATTGFYRPRSHDLVPVERCAIESDYSKRAAAAVRVWMDEWSIPDFSPDIGKGVRRVYCRFGFSSGEGQTVLVTGKGEIPHLSELTDTLIRACPETVSVMRNINAEPGDTVLGRDFRPIWGAEKITDELLGLKFSLAPDAFYQVNRTQAERLYSKAIEYAGLDGTQNVLDLYCGTGTITLCLAKKARAAVGVEIVESAVKNAVKNAEANGIENARFLCGDAAELTAKLRGEGFIPDVVVVDPPRKGLSPDAPALIASMSPQRVVYVSCDPGTLARDVKTFAALGYTVTRAAAVDMFPRTRHVETVVQLSR
jgi:23S rRNA (uracil1939-C5)-methyltransferase